MGNFLWITNDLDFSQSTTAPHYQIQWQIKIFKNRFGRFFDFLSRTRNQHARNHRTQPVVHQRYSAPNQ